MSRNLPVVTGREVEKVAVRAGFLFDRQRGSHAVYFRERDGRRVVIPIHPGRTLKPKTLAAIIDDLGLTVDEFRDMV